MNVSQWLKGAAMAAAAALFAGAARADTLATWSLNRTLDGNSEYTNALSVGAITAGSGVSSLSLVGKGYSGQGWNSASRNDEAYFQFSVTAADDFQVEPGELAMNFRSSKNGPAKAEVRWSLDGTNWTSADTFNVPQDGNDTGHPFSTDFSDATIAAGKTATFRIYAWGASSKSGTFRIGNSYAMTLSGTVKNADQDGFEKEPVPYVVRGWDGSEGTESDAVCTSFTVYNGQTTLRDGWYVVAGNVTNDNRIEVSGEVHLILVDGATLTVPKGITVSWTDNSLAVYGQTNGTGRLFAGTDGTTNEWGQYIATCPENCAGIGGGMTGAGGDVAIHGGTVVAQGGHRGAGIGGGDTRTGGKLAVYGGTVAATGGQGGAGIGGGETGTGGKLAVYGGTVTATGGQGGAGIGGGYLGAGGDVAIHGGTVTATGVDRAAAIGKGDGGRSDGGLEIAGMKVGHADGDGRVVSWAAPDQRDACCRNREGKSVRLEACNPHDTAGAVCSRCGRESFLVRKLYDNQHWDKTRYSTVELVVYSEAAKNPNRQGCCLTYVTEGGAIDLTDNLDGDGEHAKLDGLFGIEQTNHFMVPFNDQGWAYLKADLQENGAIRVTGEFGPYNPSYEAEAPNGKDRRMTLSTAGLLNGQTFYVIERSPGDYDPTGYVYVGDDAEADPRVDSSAMTTTWKLDQAVMDGTDPVPENEPNHVPATVEAGALYLTGTTTGEGTTVFVVNSFDMGKVSPTYFQFLEATASVPWDGRVSFFFHPGSPAQPLPVWNPPFLSIVATDTATGSNYVSTASALSAESPERLNAALHAATDDDTLDAPFTVTWDMSALVPDDFSTTGMVFTVDYLALPEYCVIDLTGGTNGASPAVSYLDAPPEGGWTDLYKTERLPMRLVPPETEGARPFYCALFETTQKQWELVTGGTPSAFPGATRPVERVSWNDIRGDAETCDWPAADAIGEDSFVGILRRRTGLSALDLPTEAQWEFACRGWRTTDYGYGHVPNGDGMWFKDNSGGETHEAGTRTTNFFGLHDMHGNVAEWCLDRASSTGPERVLRGGGWDDYAPACTSSSRSGHDPATGDGHCGFRLVRHLPLDSESERRPEAEPGGLRVGTVPTQDEEDPTIVSYSCASEAIALSRVVPHTVIFTWHGGSFETNYPHGTALRVPETPAPYTEGGTNYGFTGWSPEVAAVVTNDATYTAQYAVVPDLAVSCVVDAFGGGGESAIFTVAGPADSNGTADVAVYADETGGGDPVWSTNGVALAEGAAELTVSIDTGVVLPGQLVVAAYLPNDKYSGATASNRVMGTSSIILTTESNYQVDDNIVLGLVAYNSTGDIAVTLWVSDGNGGLTEFDWECAVVENTVEVGELPAGEYVVTAVLAGDANYLGSTDTKSFRVDKLEPGLEAEAGETTEGEPVVVTATLGYDDCTGTVTVAVDGSEYVGDVVDGVAAVIISDLAAGDYEATATYSGDDKYLEASTNFTIKVAAARPFEEVDGVIWYYEPVGSNAMVTGIAEAHATGNLTMPDTLGGLTVTEVVEDAFKNCTDITGMAVASGVTNIGRSAFDYCESLTDMTIPDLVTDIGDLAFFDCHALTNLCFGAGVTNIGDNAFGHCWNLAALALPEGLVSIGESAFFLCAHLPDVRIPDATAEIGKWAFEDCESLTNVWLGTGIESVRADAFSGCTNLATIWIPVEQEGTELLKEAGLPGGCDKRYYGTQVVKFDANGGTCDVKTNGYTIGEAYGWLPAAEREGYDFTGWWDEAAGVRLAATDTVTEEASRTVYARWEAIPSADIDGVRWLFRTNEVGVATVAGAIPADGDLAIPDELDGVPVTAVGDDAFRNCTNLTGMTVANGVTNIGAGAFAGCDSLTNAWIGTGIESVGAGAFTNCPNLATVWAPVEQQGTGLLDAAGLPEGCEIRYHGTQTVTFEPNGGTCAVGTNEYEFGAGKTYGALPEAARTGYDFLGWFDEAGGRVQVTAADAVPEETARTLTARWRLGGAYYTVAFNRNGGTGTMEPQVIPRGTKAWLRYNAFRRADHTFMGWAETWNGAVVHADHAAVTDRAPAGGSITFYARWAKTKYTVAFDANGGTGSMAAQGMTYGTSAALRKNAFRRGDWVFIGWARWKNGPVVYADGASVKNLRTDGKTTTLYAKWAKKTYTVAFDANGGKLPTNKRMKPQTFEYGKGKRLQTNVFIRSGSFFVGWATTKDGPVVYEDGQWVKNLRTDGGTLRLYAKWVKKAYTVTYDGNGGKGTMHTQLFIYGHSQRLTANQYKRSGWTFTGWGTSKAGPVVYADGELVKNLRTDGGDTKLYAQWKKNAAAAGRSRAVKSEKRKVKSGNGAVVTTSDGADGSAVCDGDEGTGWAPEGESEGWAWVVVAFPEPVEVGDVEVVGDGLEAARVLWSEDAETWEEEMPGMARYVWVAWEAGEEGATVREVRRRGAAQ